MIELSTPAVGQLEEVVRTLRGWQRDDAPIQLHPGDLGWNWRSGAAALAADLRTWRRDGDVVAIGYLDAPDVLRLTVSGAAWDDDELADRVLADVSDRGSVLPAGKVAVAAPDGSRVKARLLADGWTTSDAWTPLRLDLGAPLTHPRLRVEVVSSDAQVAECTAVHRAAWGKHHFTDERWRTMASGVPFSEARCLLGRDASGVAVATLIAWSAGAGRPGLIEPLGVHPDHRRRGYGAMICVAAGVRLQAMGASSVMVCTPSSLHSAIATYEAAGYQRQPERLDLCREGTA